MQKSSIIRTSLVALGLSLASASFGGTITIASSASETANSTSSATVNVIPDPGWGTAFSGSSWVSYVQSGDSSQSNFVFVPNGTTVTFTDTFSVSGTPTSGQLSIMADDLVSVSLNGVQLTFTPLNSGTSSSGFSVGWTAATAGLAALGNLQSGTNTLSFVLQQTQGGGYGLDYSAVITTDSSTNAVTPEPGTLALVGLPLAALGFLRLRKAKA